MAVRAADGNAREQVIRQVRHWRDELIALGRRNRVVYFRPTRSATLMLEQPSLGTIVNRLKQRSGSWGFYEPPAPPPVEEDDPEPEPFDRFEVRPLKGDELLTQKADAPALLRSLRLLDRKSKQEFLGKGLWVLHLAAGLLRWIDSDDEDAVLTPILLIPVRLARESPRDPYRLVMADGDVVVNPAMLAKLESDFAIQFPALDDVREIEPLSYLAEVESMVEERGWSVQRRCVLDAFSFHKEVMYRDLQRNESHIVDHPLVQALALGADARLDFGFDPPAEADLDETYPPEETITILDADASQRRCLAVAREGRSFVMDGPPGTGKSQTIANLIAQGLTSGKSILFVSEKIAALEIVEARLNAAGLGEYLLEMHSQKATRKEVAQTLYRALTLQPKVPPGMDAQQVSALRQRREELSAYANALNEHREPLGRTLFDAIGRVAQLHAVEQAPLPDAVDTGLLPATLGQIMEFAGELARAWGPVVRVDQFFWHGLNMQATTMGGKRGLLQAVDACDAAMSALQLEAGSMSSRLELWWDDAAVRVPPLVEVAEEEAR